MTTYSLELTKEELELIRDHFGDDQVYLIEAITHPLISLELKLLSKAVEALEAIEQTDYRLLQEKI
jgi:hypothetical protein